MVGSKGHTFYIQHQCVFQKNWSTNTATRYLRIYHILRSYQLCFIYTCLSLISMKCFLMFFTSISLTWSGIFLCKSVCKYFLLWKKSVPILCPLIFLVFSAVVIHILQNKVGLISLRQTPCRLNDWFI